MWHPIQAPILQAIEKMYSNTKVITLDSADWCPSGGNSAPTLHRAVEGREEEPGFTLAPQGPVGTPKRPWQTCILLTTLPYLLTL